MEISINSIKPELTFSGDFYTDNNITGVIENMELLNNRLKYKPGGAGENDDQKPDTYWGIYGYVVCCQSDAGL